MGIAEPMVILWGHTVVTDAVRDQLEQQPGITDAEHLTDAAGRGCYESWHRPNPATADTRDYIERTVFEQGHGSILEHAYATLRIEGVSRAFLTELTRHRHLGFSVRSQRFVNEQGGNIVLPPAIRDHPELSARFEGFYESAIELYDDAVEALLGDDLPRKQAREAARAVLPNMQETRMTVSGNLRAWKQVIDRRTAPDADAEMREVMGMANDVLAGIAPSVFDR